MGNVLFHGYTVGLSFDWIKQQTCGIFFSSATGVCVGRCSENICFFIVVSAILLYKEFGFKDVPKG